MKFNLFKKNIETKTKHHDDTLVAESDVLFLPDGNINCKPEDNIDLKRGLFQGVGFSLSSQNKVMQRIYAPWSSLNAHKLTIITTFNGIEFGKPYLSESDKYQIKYPAKHRLLYGRWLSVYAERVNISVDGVITTVDEEYVLDKSPKNKSTFVASLSHRSTDVWEYKYKK